MKRLVVFTDLDGTLLDSRTYRWQVAEPSVASSARSQSAVPATLLG